MHNIIVSLLLIINFLSQVAFAKELNLYKFSPSETTINNEKFPRNERLLYRGLPGAQMSLEMSIRAMLGDKSANVESPMLFTVKQVLMGKGYGLLSELSDLLEEYRQLDIQSKITQAQQEKQSAFTEEEAFNKAVQILSEAYSDEYTRRTVFDYSSSYLKTFPRAFLFSSVHLEVAKIYSNHILLFNDHPNSRNLDVNYWNYINNGKWVHTNLSFPDRGEFVSAFYISHKDIVGYQHNRTAYSAYWNIWSDLKTDLGYVAMKHSYNNVDYVYIFDGFGLQHIVPSGNEFCAAISRFNPRVDLPSYTQTNCNIKPKIVAITRLCTDSEHKKKTCSVDPKLFANYEVSQRNNTELLGLLKHVFINGNKVYFFTEKNQNYSNMYIKENDAKSKAK